ncbi:MAG: tetratricopeptide repeat protein [Saprospiraceae bacterium]|nr:tetratricopeptide repeat protein [Saprospiraceae bacterium]
MKYWILSIFLLWSGFGYGQLPEYGSRGWGDYIHTGDFLQEGLYGASRTRFESFSAISSKPMFPYVNRIHTTADVDACISALRQNSPDAESQMIKKIAYLENLPEVTPAVLELASYYYNEGRYEESIVYYDKIIDQGSLSEREMSEVSFKKGYAYFINKQFASAKQQLSKTRELRDEYFYGTNYYYGMCQYFDKDFTGAVESFKRAANSPLYTNHIPYLISQIYFIQGDFDKLISYGEHKITEKDVENVKEIRLLLGQAYFLRSDYKRALPHLEFYESKTEKLSAEEFYQLAFSQYKLDACAKARSNFAELSNLDSKMGQLSNYYLADCFLKLGDKNSARSAFRKVASMSYDMTMSAEAQFNYGKVSAELGSEREAINALLETNEKSRYFAESQEIINDILINSGDYLNSVKIIESLPMITSSIKKTYQLLSLKQGIQYVEDGNGRDAVIFFDKSLKYPGERLYEAQAYYWKAHLAYNEADYPKSINLLESYFEKANGLYDLPEESASYMAHYLQGYNYLKSKEYKKSELQFKNCVVGINIKREEMKNDYILQRVLPDAFIRTGDCLFKQNQYLAAGTFYDQAITRKQGGYVYALFQKGLIEGLSDNPDAKLSLMQDILTNHPISEYADDACLQLGETHLAQMQPEKAAVYFTDLRTKFGGKSPFHNIAGLKLGLIAYNKGNYISALSLYKQVIQNNPSPSERNAAMKSIEEIYIDEMANSKAYLKYLDSIPGDENAKLSRDSLSYHLVMNIFNNADYKNAVEGFTEYLANFPLGSYKNDARYFRAESNNVLKAYQQSIKDYEAIIADGEGKYYTRSIFKSALISYSYTQNFEKALKYYKISAQISNDPGELFQSDFGALKSAFKLVIDADILAFGNKVVASAAATRDERSSAHYYLGKTYFRLRDLPNAIKSFQFVDQNGNNNQAAESRYLLAEVYMLQNDVAKAEQQCNYANEKNTNYPYWVARGLLLLSDVYIQKDDLLNARAAIEAVIENFKEDATILNTANEKLALLKTIEMEATRLKSNSDKFDLQSPNKKN